MGKQGYSIVEKVLNFAHIIAMQGLSPYVFESSRIPSGSKLASERIDPEIKHSEWRPLNGAPYSKGK